MPHYLTDSLAADARRGCPVGSEACLRRWVVTKGVKSALIHYLELFFPASGDVGASKLL